MIIKNNNDGTIEVQMVHNVILNKLNPLEGFKQYTDTITKELEYEITRSFHPMAPPTRSHIIVPD